MRADRLLKLLLTLQAQGPQSAQALAQRLEVSVRTVQRDLEALGMAGVPVVAQRGQGGGWRLLEPWRTELTQMSAEELQALTLPLSAALLGQLGLGEAREAAWTKLLAALPQARRAQAQAWQRVHVDPTTWRGALPQAGATFATLQQAVFAGRGLAIRYRQADGEEGDRLVSPFGLVAKGSTWYLVAQNEAGAWRSYRCSRVLEARLTEAQVSPPAGFNLAEHWATTMGEFTERLPECHIRVRVAPELLPRLRFSTGGRYVRLLGVGEAQPDGWCEAQFACDTEDEALAFALGHGPQLALLEPKAWRAKLAARAQMTQDLYSQAP